MLLLDDLFQLVYHYRLSNEKDCFNKAIEMARNELSAVLDDTREYPPFMYYLMLAYMDGNEKYYGKKFCRMNDAEKTELFNETIEALIKFTVE